MRHRSIRQKSRPSVCTRRPNRYGALRASQVIGCDETGTHIDGNGFSRRFGPGYYLIADNRNSCVIDDASDNTKPQIWVSDCFSARIKAIRITATVMYDPQLCDLQYGVDVESATASATVMEQLLKRALRLNADCDELPQNLFIAQVP